jgi:cytoskeletal protein CcmA (bactofilin family)
VVLGATARITGDVHYGAIEMTLGARIDGRLVPQAAAARVAAVPPVAAAPAAAAPTAPELELQPFDAAAPRN